MKTTASSAVEQLAFRLEPLAKEKSKEGQDVRQSPPVIMNEAQVAEFLGICPRSVRNFKARGLLPVIRLGRRRLYRRDAVLAALRTMER